jgi:ribosomal protein S18 acetylase RimI-like enzyme
MDEYVIRKATIEDADFIAQVIIGAEKSMTDYLGLATFFELTEQEIKQLIIKMLDEEIDGCEFSISSYFVASYKGKPVAALGGWLEGYFDGMPSAILKSNLIGFIFPKESIKKAQLKNEIIKEIQIEREKGAYQLEYSFVDSDHRGKRLTQRLMKEHLDFAKQLDSNVKKAQLQVFENNTIITKVHQGSGFKIVKRYVSSNVDILNYLPYNVKLLMEKEI